MTTQLNIEDPQALRSYLVERGAIGPDEAIEAEALAGGVSNRAMLVRRPTGEAWVLKQALSKLRTEADWFADPQRVHREAEGMRQLATLCPPGTIPAFIFEDREHHVLAMEAIPQPHETWKQRLMDGRASRDEAEQFGRTLAAIHTQAAGQDQLRAAFADRGYFESLRLEPYYGYAATQLPDAADDLQALAEQTRQRSLTLVHGDYSPKNILVCGDRMVLLDHEVIHWGDPAFDVGFGLTHLLSKAHHFPDRRGELHGFALAAWENYRAGVPEDEWAQALERWAVRHTLGCLIARARGRSTLEYLSEPERARQARAAAKLMKNPPARIAELAERFLNEVSDADDR